MEKDGPLDQLLLAALNVLTATWLGVLVALVGGFAVALLARLSPKTSWEYLKEGPGVVLTGAFLLLAGIRSVPQLVLPKQNFVCNADKTDCRFVAEGSIRVEYEYTFGDFLREFFSSLFLEGVLGLVGAGLGVAVAAVVLRRRAPRA